MAINSEKKSKNQIPDYEVLFQNSPGQTTDKKVSGIPKMLLKQNIWKILFSTVLYVIKASPTWVIPLVTAEIINLVTTPNAETPKKIIIYGVILFLLLIQNIPTHVLWYEKYVNNILRTISAGLRNTLIKKLQHLSITYHKEIESGKIQSKFLRDIEAIEFLNTYFVKSVIPCLINIIVSIVIVLMKSGIVTLFFLVVIPINVATIYLFRSSMSDTNRRFRKETENISAKVSNMLDMIPVTKAHGLENEEIAILEENIRTLREKGLVLDNVNA